MPSASLYIQVKSKPSFQQIQARFTAAQKKQDERKHEAMRDLGREWVAAMRAEAPTGKTGNFKKHISYKTFASGPTVELRGYIPQPLGKWITKGTRAHMIYPKRGKYLAFFWPRGFDGPRMYFFRHVHHPGTKPNPFDQRAMARWKPKAVVALRKLSSQFVMDVKGT